MRSPSPLGMKKMVTICGNAGVFKSDFQADIEDYTPSPENMRKLLKLLFHDEKWLTPECVESRYADSIAPGAWEALSAARLKRPGLERGSTVEAFKKQLSGVDVPLLIISCDHDPLNQSGLGRAAAGHRAGLKRVPLPGFGPRAADRGTGHVRQGLD